MRRAVLIASMSVMVFGIGIAVPEQAPAQSPSEGDFSAGIVLGQPTGLSFKWWAGETVAFDAVAAWSFFPGRLYFHTDYLQHFFNLFDVAPDQLPAYVGIGGKVALDFAAVDSPDFVNLGGRIPVGISFLSQELPLDIFLEIAPGIRLVPDVQPVYGAGVGVRYRF